MGFNEIMQMFAHIYFCILQINAAQGSAKMDNFSPKEESPWKKPMVQKMGPKVVPKWTTFAQRKIPLKKNQWLKRAGPKCRNG
jgi:hypothetical protein